MSGGQSGAEDHGTIQLSPVPTSLPIANHHPWRLSFSPIPTSAAHMLHLVVLYVGLESCQMIASAVI
jgi:hypothetical protein